jgi:hypothetical protein
LVIVCSLVVHAVRPTGAHRLGGRSSSKDFSIAIYHRSSNRARGPKADITASKTDDS